MGAGLHVGLIGGLGPAATVIYYKRMCDIAAERAVSLDMTIVNAEIREVLANNLAGRGWRQAEIFADLIGRLKAAGADFAAIPAIGPLFCWDEIRALSPLPLLSAVKPLNDFCAKQGLQRIGLLGTGRAMATRLFGQLRSAETLVPSNLDSVGKAYEQMAIASRCDDETRHLLFAAGQKMIDDGAQAVALAGTDLLLAFDGFDPGYAVIDVLDLHAQMLADLATGHLSLAEAGLV